VQSLGEELIVRPKTGAIALMTTTRTVFAFSNRVMNDNYLRIALQRDSAGKYKTLGEAVQAAKNFTYQNFGDVANNRKFTLLGDPAMTLAFPKLQVTATTINGVDLAADADTLQAMDMVNLQGEVKDKNGVLLNNFNGTVYLSLFDKPQTVTTLGNDPTSFKVPFSVQTGVLFKGKATVTAGKFLFNFKLPKDINYQYGKGKISLYAQNGADDGGGFSNNIIIGGLSTNASSDREGPTINAYLNNEQFVGGSITGSTPILILKLTDSSGINTGGTGIGHDLVATLDNDNRTYFVLNSFYESELDNYQKGSLRFQLPELAPGRHSLKIKAWDAVNNSSEHTLEFIVNNKNKLVIDHVLNYPNPFTTKTAFWFEHNQSGEDLKVKVEVFTVTGKLVKTLQQTINNSGNRSSDLEWDGRDDLGDKVGRGVYVYRLQVIAPNGKKASMLQKLMILR
ncbi:MAG TPA: type IX secretion system sortase PorU, partial [Chitinophagaceae bacterium]|nr:type IX secretion system sortase PorU [Chitinophagaceae bacterium]